VCLASSLLFLARPKIWLGPTLLSVLAFGLCRDSNAYLILMLAGLAAMLAAIRAARRRSWWPSAGLALGLLFAFSIVNASADLGMRWEYPLTNVIVSRVLPDPVRRAAFHAQGMPNPPSLAPRRARRFYGSDPSIEPVRNWIAAHGKPTYARFLLSSPRYLLTEPKLVELLGGHVEGYGPPGMRDNLPQFVERLWSEGAWSIQLVVVVALAVACILVPTARVNPLGVVGLCLAVSVFPHALVIWHGDTMETARHELQAVVQLRVSLILLLLALTDTLLAGRHRSWKERAQSSRAAAA